MKQDQQKSLAANHKGAHRYRAGTAYAYQDVKLTFDADAVQFVVQNSQGEEIKKIEDPGSEKLLRKM